MPPASASRQALGLFGWLLLTFAAAAIGAVASAEAGAFYGQLARPSWAPPGWLFAPVWSVLYFLIAATVVSFWRLSALAGAMLLPYLAWVTFASALTFSTWTRNPALL